MNILNRKRFTIWFAQSQRCFLQHNIWCLQQFISFATFNLNAFHGIFSNWNIRKQTDGTAKWIDANKHYTDKAIHWMRRKSQCKHLNKWVRTRLHLKKQRTRRRRRRKKWKLSNQILRGKITTTATIMALAKELNIFSLLYYAHRCHLIKQLCVFYAYCDVDLILNAKANTDTWKTFLFSYNSAITSSKRHQRQPNSICVVFIQ